MKKIIVILLMLVISYPSNNRTIITVFPTYLQEVVVSPVNYDSVVLLTLWNNGISIDLSYIILAQFKHETGGFTSNIFIEGNNMSGMKHPSVRKTLSLGTHRKHAKYASVEDCILDYVYYLEARKLPTHEVSVKKYLKLLKNKGYFEDDFNSYYKGVRNYYKEINS